MTRPPSTPSRQRTQSLAASSKTSTPTGSKSTISLKERAQLAELTPATADPSIDDGSPPRPPNAWILYRSFKLEQLKKAESENGTPWQSDKKRRSASPAKGALTASALAALANMHSESTGRPRSRTTTPSLISDPTSASPSLWAQSSFSHLASSTSSIASPSAANSHCYTPISSLLAKMWKSEPEEVKNSFHKLAKTKEAEHRKMWPDYKYKPKETSKSLAARERRRRGMDGEPASSLVDPSSIPKSLAPQMKPATLQQQKAQSPARIAARPYPSTPLRLAQSKVGITLNSTDSDKTLRRSPRLQQFRRTSDDETLDRKVSVASTGSNTTIIDHGPTVRPGTTENTSSQYVWPDEERAGSKLSESLTQVNESSPKPPLALISVSTHQGSVWPVNQPNTSTRDQAQQELRQIQEGESRDLPQLSKDEPHLTLDLFTSWSTDFEGFQASWQTFDHSSVCPELQQGDTALGAALETATTQSSGALSFSDTTFLDFCVGLSSASGVGVGATSSEDTTMGSATVSLTPSAGTDSVHQTTDLPWCQEHQDVFNLLNQHVAENLNSPQMEAFLVDPKDSNVLPSQPLPTTRTQRPTSLIASGVMSYDEGEERLSSCPEPYRQSTSSSKRFPSTRFPQPRRARWQGADFPVPTCATFCGKDASGENTWMPRPEMGKSISRKLPACDGNQATLLAAECTVYFGDSPIRTKALEQSEARTVQEQFAQFDDRLQFEGQKVGCKSPRPTVPLPDGLAELNDSLPRTFDLHGRYTEQDLWALLLEDVDSSRVLSKEN